MIRVETENESTIALGKSKEFRRFEPLGACCEAMSEFMQQSNDKQTVYIDFLRTGKILHPLGILGETLIPNYCLFCGTEMKVYVRE